MSTATNGVAERIAQRREEKAEIRRGLELLHDPGDVFEIRALDVPSGRFKNIWSGYFNDFDKAAEAAHKLDHLKGAGVYVTLNPVQPALLARSNNEVMERPKATTTDKEALRRKWLFIDVDPDRLSGIPATNEEHATALDLAEEIEEKLRGMGWPYSLCEFTGNGEARFYRIDLPNDDDAEDLIKRVYRGINSMLGTVDPSKPYSTLDVTVHNAARICRIPGTMNRKGAGTADRPHRRASMADPIEDCPVAMVTRQQLEAVAALAADDGSSKTTITTTANAKAATNGRSRLDVPTYLQARGIEFTIKAQPHGSAYLVPCPFDANHGRNGEAAVFQAESGQLTFECKHASCAGRRWADYRDAVGKPENHHWDPPLGVTTNSNGKADDNANGEEEASKVTLEVISSADFATARYHDRFLVKKVLVAGEPAIVGGRYKCLKTSIMLDLALSLGAGVPFLGTFEVPKATGVVLFSGESGRATLQRLALRMAEVKGVQLADAQVHWGWTLPQIARVDHLDALCEVIQTTHADVAIIDPAYLSLLAGDVQGRQSSNIFDMGSLLLGLTEVGQHTGATVILVHHCRKNPIEPWGVPELEELSMAGFAEWARQWLLLGRREAFAQGSGKHRLWLNIGGSAGHSGCYAVDVDEGTIDDQFNGRKWDVTCSTVSDAKAEARRERESRRAKEQEAKEIEHKRRLVDAMRQFPAGETCNTLSSAAGLNKENLGRAITTLLKEGRIEACQVTKNGAKHDGYRLIK